MAPFCPCVKLPTCVLVMARSAPIAAATARFAITIPAPTVLAVKGADTGKAVAFMMAWIWPIAEVIAAPERDGLACLTSAAMAAAWGAAAEVPQNGGSANAPDGGPA